MFDKQKKSSESNKYFPLWMGNVWPNIFLAKHLLQMSYWVRRFISINSHKFFKIKSKILQPPESLFSGNCYIWGFRFLLSPKWLDKVHKIASSDTFLKIYDAAVLSRLQESILTTITAIHRFRYSNSLLKKRNSRRNQPHSFLHNFLNKSYSIFICKVKLGLLLLT